MKFYLILLIELLASLVIAVSGFRSLERLGADRFNARDQAAEVFYLPNGQALEFLSFGFRNVLANALWFKSVSYFGKHYKSDQNYQWLYHMVNLVTTLDPNATYATEFASMMLSWEADRPTEAIDLLSKAIAAHPDSWRLYYFRGFTYMYFLQDIELARADFITGSKCPNAPAYLTRLAAQVIAQQSDPQAAVNFLKSALATAADDAMRTALEDKLKEAYLEIDLGKLREAIEIYTAQKKEKPTDIQELIASGIVQTLPPDPFGGTYYIDPVTSEPKSTSDRKGLQRKARQFNRGENEQHQ